MHNSFGNCHIICLIKSILNHEVVVILVEVKVEHKVRRKQVVHESDVCQIMRESLNSSQKYPSNFLSTSSSEILAISGLVLTFINENILLVSLYHKLDIVTEEQPVELFLIEWMYEAEVLINFLGLLDLNQAEFVEFLVNCSRKGRIFSEITLISVPIELTFVNCNWILVLQKSMFLVPTTEIGKILFIVLKYFIVVKWL